jgi:hypothetical protein
MSHAVFLGNSSIGNSQQAVNYRQIYELLTQRISPDALQWLTQTIEQITQQNQSEDSNRFFLTAFSLLPKRLNKGQIQENSQPNLMKRSRWIEDCPDWTLEHWSLETLGRSLLLLSQTPDRLKPLFSTLYNTGSSNEQVALLQILPLLADNDRYLYWAQEGFRSHITAVFNAITLSNPYPTQYFDSTTWNQLILKAIFVGSPLHLIMGLDDRANTKLARMAIDYVHERWAAKRNVTPEIWRLISPYVEAGDRSDLCQALQMPNALQKQAVALLCHNSSLSEISSIMVDYPDLHQQVTSGLINWEYIYQQQC